MYNVYGSGGVARVPKVARETILRGIIVLL